MTKPVVAQICSGCWIIRPEVCGAISYVAAAGREGEAIIVISVLGIRRAKPETDSRTYTNPTTSLVAASPIPTMVRGTMGGGSIAAAFGTIHLLTASAVIIDRCSIAVTNGSVPRHVTFFGHVVLRHLTFRHAVTNRLATFSGYIIARRSSRCRSRSRHRLVLRYIGRSVRRACPVQRVCRS